ncbi:hypothetical protein LCGC14_1113630 [marine sediment metagenome]|uniref:Uncharacterized protein n=1 Tax=marine sediment metagenome TaxID=412755 RepID=A0A0F9MAS8_9ZZZZ
MTAYHDVRDALCKLREGAYGNAGINGNGPRLLTDWTAFSLAPIFVRAIETADKRGTAAGINSLLEEETP